MIQLTFICNLFHHHCKAYFHSRFLVQVYFSKLHIIVLQSGDSYTRWSAIPQLILGYVVSFVIVLINTLAASFVANKSGQEWSKFS